MARRPSWEDSAVCRDLPLEESARVFFGQYTALEALALCAACPVVESCRALCDRLEHNSTDRCQIVGVWAAETPRQRIDRRRAAAARAGVVPGRHRPAYEAAS